MRSHAGGARRAPRIVPISASELGALRVGEPAFAAEAVADSVAEQAIVAEYRAWAMRLRASGALVMAEKLADDPVTRPA